MPSDAVLRDLFSRTQQYAVPLHSCRAVAHAVIQSLRCGSVFAHVTSNSCITLVQDAGQNVSSMSVKLILACLSQLSM